MMPDHAAHSSVTAEAALADFSFIPPYPQLLLNSHGGSMRKESDTSQGQVLAFLQERDIKKNIVQPLPSAEMKKNVQLGVSKDTGSHFP